MRPKKKVGVRLDSVWAELVAANNSKTNQFKNFKKVPTSATYYIVYCIVWVLQVKVGQEDQVGKQAR